MFFFRNFQLCSLCVLANFTNGPVTLAIVFQTLPESVKKLAHASLDNLEQMF